MTIVQKNINVTYSTFDNAKRIADILLVFLRNYSLAWPLFLDSTSVRKNRHYLHDDRVILI